MATIIVLDRIEPGEPEPEYCIHGRTPCMGGCGEWVWLGDQSFKIVESGTALPVCMQCAYRLVPPEERNPIRGLRDRRRSEGPH